MCKCTVYCMIHDKIHFLTSQIHSYCPSVNTYITNIQKKTMESGSIMCIFNSYNKSKWKKINLLLNFLRKKKNRQKKQSNKKTVLHLKYWWKFGSVFISAIFHFRLRRYTHRFCYLSLLPHERTLAFTLLMLRT